MYFPGMTGVRSPRKWPRTLGSISKSSKDIRGSFIRDPEQINTAWNSEEDDLKKEITQSPTFIFLKTIPFSDVIYI